MVGDFNYAMSGQVKNCFHWTDEYVPNGQKFHNGW